MVGNASHTLAYSLIGLQELNLAYRYPIIFWNCACLIADSGGAEDSDSKKEEEVDILLLEDKDIVEENEDDSLSNLFDDDSDDDDDDDDATIKTKKKKAKTKTTDFGKIATAIGKMGESGIVVVPPDINKSGYTFTPDIENDEIRYGLMGITNIGETVVQRILDNRPYTGLEDFVKKIGTTKPQTVNLIKAGAFDSFGDRYGIMESYINSICGKKNLLNLRNLKQLLDLGLMPEEYDFNKKVFFFNKYLRKAKTETDFLLDTTSLTFYEKHFDMDLLTPIQNDSFLFAINQKIWDKIYQKYMDPFRDYIKKEQNSLIKTVNSILYKEMWDKYSTGSLSKWEMDSVSYYSHDHELKELSYKEHGIRNFFTMEEEPPVKQVFYKAGKEIPLYHLSRIAGTVLDRDSTKGLVILLTREGIVNVKIFKASFSYFDRQISKLNPQTGKKNIVERSWFKRGNKIIVNGMRRGDFFFAKKYANTKYPVIELITEIDDSGAIKTKKERVVVE